MDVLCTGLGRVVGDEDDLLVESLEQVDGLHRAGNNVVSEPDDTVAVEDERVVLVEQVGDVLGVCELQHVLYRCLACLCAVLVLWFSAVDEQ